MRHLMVSFLALGSTLVFCGCAHYQYRLVQPAATVQPIGKNTIKLPYEPLEYRLARRGDHIAMRVVNPTDEPVSLLSAKSYVVDPAGETHPVRGRTIAPHSYVGLFLPPVPRTYSAPYYGGWGPPVFGFDDPFAFDISFGHPFYPFGLYDPFFYEPIYSYRVVTPFDWEWKTGEVRVRLAYEQAGKNFFHNFAFDREKIK